MQARPCRARGASSSPTDGSITIHFGAEPEAVNNLSITPGWHYAVRMYQPRPEIINGSWTFLLPLPIN